MYMFAEYGTFSAANMVTFNKINSPEFIMIPMGAAISLIGMGTGVRIRYTYIIPFQHNLNNAIDPLKIPLENG